MTTGPGPYLFGPLLTFNYAARGIPSPLHQPPYWQGGTSYPLSWEPEMIREWQARRFETLIYLRGGRVNYPKELDDIIDRDYVLDETYPRLDVYHRRK